MKAQTALVRANGLVELYSKASVNLDLSCGNRECAGQPKDREARFSPHDSATRKRYETAMVRFGKVKMTSTMRWKEQHRMGAYR